MTTRQQNRLKRNQRIQEAYRTRYLNAPRPRLHSREYVLSQLAEQYCLAVATVEDIVYQQA